MRAIWTVLGRRCITDQDTNNLSMVDVVEQLRIVGAIPPERPLAFPIALEIISLWERSEPEVGETGKARLRFLSPQGEQLVEAELKVDLTTLPRHRTKLTLAAVPLTTAGRYLVVIDTRHPSGSWEVRGEVPLYVEMPSVPPPEASLSGAVSASP
ncbi:MAG: hypothetical protein IT186_12145 [Acidobacteria bacterium]|nr:hypothetical protein [Acidobacteriota bacterium]